MLLRLCLSKFATRTKKAMSMAVLLQRASKLQNRTFLCNVSRRFGSICTAATDFSRNTGDPFQVRSMSTPSEATGGFGEMVVGSTRKYYILGGKGGVGKTSCAASLAVKFANSGHPTIVVSTDPAHSLSDSFDHEEVSVPVEGVDSPLFGLELSPEKRREEIRTASQDNGGHGVKNIMNSMGLGMLSDQLGDLKLGELLDNPPPGFDEAIAISKVMQFVDSQEYNMFTRIVFDTAPTLRKTLSALKSVFGKQETQRDATDKLEHLRERMSKVRNLFRDPNTTEFIIITIPTVMALNESSRLHASLKKESAPVQRLIVNQVLPPSASNCKFCEIRRKDQTRALGMIRNDPELSTLRVVEAPLLDVEIQGVPALKFMGNLVWK